MFGDKALLAIVESFFADAKGFPATKEVAGLFCRWEELKRVGSPFRVFGNLEF